jgi:ABC-2 type transport system ATP-binding protein
MIDRAAPVLILESVRKAYRGREALRGISLQLYPGELLGFFGPNGAGKTTMIRCIAGLVTPDSGRIAMQIPEGFPGSRRIRPGLVPQNIAVYPDLTVRQNLEVFGRLEGVSGKQLRERIPEVLDWAALADRAGSLTRTLSGGMQRRLNIACSVLHRPAVLLLDEPTVGVDPQSRERIYAMMQQLKEQGTAVLITTHQLEEVETRCDRIVVIDHGAIVAEGQLQELIQRSLGLPHRVVLEFARPTTVDLPGFEMDDNRQSAVCRLSDMQELPRILRVLEGLPAPPLRIDVRSFGLQDVFLALTGRSLRE